MTCLEPARGEEFHADLFARHGRSGGVALNRVAWTDDRIDDAMARIDRGFDRLSDEMREMRVEMHTEFRALRGEILAGQRQMTIIGFSIAGALLAQLIAFIAT